MRPAPTPRFAAATSPGTATTRPPTPLPWRRSFLLYELLAALVGADALRLKAADALADLRATTRDLHTPSVGERVWDRFEVGRDASLGYCREIVRRVTEGLGDEPLAAELEREFRAVSG